LTDISALFGPCVRGLQKSSITHVEAKILCDELLQLLRDRRSQADHYFALLFAKANDINRNLCGSDIAMPRCTVRQTHRNNVPGESAEEYYRKAIYNPTLDNIIVDIEDRFNIDNVRFLVLRNVLPDGNLDADDNEPQALLKQFNPDTPIALI